MITIPTIRSHARDINRKAIDTIVFLTESPFNQRDYERFGIDLFVRNRFTVQVWEVPHKPHGEWLRNSSFAGYRKIASLSEFIELLDSLSASTYLISTLTYRFESSGIYREISKRRIPYAVLAVNAIPTPIPAPSWSDFLRKVSPSRLAKGFFARQSLLRVKRAQAVLAGGEQSLRANPLIDRTTTVIWSHCMDYDLYLGENKNTTNNIPKQCVFLDEAGPFHPDFEYENVRPPIGPEEYYRLLRSFFELLETRYGLHVVIAAHPRSSYAERSEYFGGRQVMMGNTIQLVRSSGYVLAHSSTAVNFAVLYQKPLILLSSDKMSREFMVGGKIRAMADALNKKIVYLDHLEHFDLENDSCVVSDSYVRYIKAFIKKEDTPELPIWEIFSQVIKGMAIHRYA